MFKRLFFAMLGLGAGVVLGGMAVRKAEEARRRVSPGNLAAVAGERAGGLRERLDVALAAGREASLAKEAELRAVYRVRTAPEAQPAPVHPTVPPAGPFHGAGETGGGGREPRGGRG